MTKEIVQDYSTPNTRWVKSAPKSWPSEAVKLVISRPILAASTALK